MRSAFLKARFRRTGSRVRTLEVCLFPAVACSYSAAFESDRTITHFAHTAWGPKDGALWTTSLGDGLRCWLRKAEVLPAKRFLFNASGGNIRDLAVLVPTDRL